MENVFKMSDEIIKNEYPDLELIYEETEILFEENIEETSEEISEEVAEGDSELNSDTPATYVLENDNSDIIAELQKNNEYWDMFLDSYPITQSFNGAFLASFITENFENYSYITSNGSVSNLSASSNGRTVVFGDLLANHSYHFTITLSNSSNTILTVGAFNGNSVLDYKQFNFERSSGVTTSVYEYDYTPSVDCSFSCSIRYANNPSYLNVSYSGTYETSESYTLSELGNAVIETQKQITLIETCILMMVVIFLVHTIIGKFIRRKK